MMEGPAVSTDLDDPGLRRRAIAAARGAEPFDLLLQGGQLIDVVTGEIRPADVGLVGPLIASVHERDQRADATRKIDCREKWLAPGLIDTHMHVESSMTTPRAYAETVLQQGTTTIVWDPHELGNVLGLRGVDWAIAASRELPLRCLILAPSCVPSAPGLELAGAEFGPDELRAMLARPEIVGVAEVMDMRGVLERQPRMSGIVQAGLEAGKLVCGHARGLAGADLQAFAAAGIQSDHEITGAEDLLAKLRAGYWIELRGSHPYLLPDCVTALRELPLLPATLTLCTDDVFPDDLVEQGGMSALLRRLIGLGMAPAAVWRCATLQAALRLGRADLGRIAPGCRADILVLDDHLDIRVRDVLVSGRLVVGDGQWLETLPGEPAMPFGPTVQVGPLAADDFLLRAAPGQGEELRLRTIVGARFTRWGECRATVVDGVVVPPTGTNRMAVIHRHGRRPAVPSLALQEDWGQWSGALATTVSHDSHNLAIFGSDPADMAAAANAVVAMQGGMAVAKAGEVIARLALPVAGLVSAAPAKETAAAFEALKRAADKVGDWAPPYRVFKAVVGASLACNAGPHLTDLGIADGTTGELTSMEVSSSP